MRRAVATLAVALALLSLSAPARAQRPDGSASPRSLIDVPYLSQGELLCGGAAAAMLMRAAGARRVYAEDFQSLLDKTAGGIHTQALADALRDRGYGVRVFHGDATRAQDFLQGGQPVLALIQDRPHRFHYVVIVGWAGQKVVFHDPARAPFMSRAATEFDRAWAPTGRWMLVIDPPAVRVTPSDGTERAPESAGLAAATARFIDRDYREAATLASQTVTRNPGDRMAWRLLGASRYLSGDPEPALDAWNHAGDPKIDLVRIDGLTRTPHRAVERLLALRPGTTLTRSDLVRADRRLALLPARQASRVTYVALPENLAEVRGGVVERAVYPSRLDWVTAGVRLGIDRELSIPLANVASAGDRITASWRFREGRPGAGLDFAFPAARAGGVVTMAVDWQREQYTLAPLTERRQAIVKWNNWLSAGLRVSAGAGLVEWRDRGGSAVLQGEAEIRTVNDGLALELGGRAVTGNGAPFTTTTATFRWRQRAGVFSLVGDHAIAFASSQATLDEWPGAGSGIARPFLLRAHPLLTHGRIGGPAFGRTLAQTSTEVQREVARRAFATVSAAAFIDVARAWDRPDGSTSPLHVDIGAGLRLHLAPGRPTIRIDIAHGLRDGNNAISAGWQVGGSSRRIRTVAL